MLTVKSIENGLARITLDVDGVVYPWAVGGLSDTPDPQAYLEANVDSYRKDIQAALDMGRELTPVDPKQDILDELAALDSLLPRAVEDIVVAANLYDSLPEIMKTRIDRKTTLRTQLKEVM